MDPYLKDDDTELDLLDKSMNQVTMEDLATFPGYKVFSNVHLTSNLFLDFCWLGKQIVLHEDFLAVYMRQYGVDFDLLGKSLNTEEQLQRVYPRSDKPRIEMYTHRAWLASPWNPREIYFPNQTFYDRVLNTNKLLD